jgi:phage tail sheath protein FI
MVQVSYPGVYVQEVSSGVRTITGVATSITAFVGRALRGPTDELGPVTITSFGDFERTFGGLWLGSALGFAVRDFFLNGGGQAIIVRCYRATTGTRSEAKLIVGTSPDTLPLRAASPGAWGNNLRVRIDHNTRPIIGAEGANTLFNLTVKDTATGLIEIFRNVSSTPGHPRQVETVLENESVLLRSTASGIVAGRLRPAPPHAAPAAGKDAFDDSETAAHTSVILTPPADAGDATDGEPLTEAQISAPGLEANKRGMFALLNADLFNLLCIPPHKLSTAPDQTAPVDVETTLVSEASEFCRKQRAFLIVDPPYGSSLTTIVTYQASLTVSNYAALYFPTLQQPDPLHDSQLEAFAPCGAVAGIMAATDAQRGVWKAPAGIDARLVGVPALTVPLTDAENGQLNPLGINCLRAMPAAGRVVWGARTLEGSDRLASEWKYIPVRRTALFIEETLYRGTQWVVFEPNDEPLWAQIRLNIGAFMQGLFRQGAFQGKTPREAYLVKCDRETTTQDDINRGIVNIIVGFAPLKPAEFVIITIQQLAGQIDT